MHRYQQILNVRRIDCRPSRYFTRRIGVCVIGVSTSHAEKLRLAFSASLVNRAATSASARRVAWIDKFDRDTGSLRLVQDEAFQLVKRPAVQTAALLFTSPYPNSETLEIFKGYSSAGAFCNTYYLFRNYVICVGRESLFFASASTQQAFGSFGAFFLQFATQTDIACTFAGHRSPRKAFSVAGVRDRHQSEIYADPVNDFDFFLVRNVNCSEEKPFFIPINQIGLTSLKLEQFPVVVSANERNFLSAIERPNTGKAFCQVPGQNPQIVTDRAVFTKLATDISIKLVGVSNFGIQANNDLSRQRELISNRSIETLVERILAKLFSFPSQFTQAIASLIGDQKRAQQGLRLLGRRLQFDLSGEIHGLYRRSILENVQTKQRTAFLWRLKATVSCLRIYELKSLSQVAPISIEMKLRILPQQLRVNHRTMRQLMRRDQIAIYEDSERKEYYEVIVVRITHPHPRDRNLEGFTHVELYPSSNQWGVYGWTFTPNSHKEPLVSAQARATMALAMCW